MGMRITNKDVFKNILKRDEKKLNLLIKEGLNITKETKKMLKEKTYTDTGLTKRKWHYRTKRLKGKGIRWEIYNDSIARGLREKYLAEFHNEGRRARTSKGRRWIGYIDTIYKKQKLKLANKSSIIIKRRS